MRRGRAGRGGKTKKKKKLEEKHEDKKKSNWQENAPRCKHVTKMATKTVKMAAKTAKMAAKTAKMAAKRLQNGGVASPKWRPGTFAALFCERSTKSTPRKNKYLTNQCSK